MGANQSIIDPSSSFKRLIAAVNSGDVTSINDVLQANPCHLKASAAVGPFASHGSGFLHLAAQRGKASSVLALCDFVENCDVENFQIFAHHFEKRSNLSKPFESVGDRRKDLLKHFVNAANRKGQTALIYACYYGNSEVVNALLERGADVFSQDRCGGRCALHYAALRGSAACVRVLLNYIKQNNLDPPADVSSNELEARRYVDVRSMCGVQPLHLAVAKGHLEATRELLAFRPRVAAPLPPSAYLDCTSQHFNNWSTPLHIAAQKGHVDVAMEIMAACIYHMQLEGRWAPSEELGNDTDAEPPSTETDSGISSFFSADLRRCVDGEKFFPSQIAAMYGHPELAEALLPSRSISQFVELYGLDLAGIAERVRGAGITLPIDDGAAAKRVGVATAKRQARLALIARLEELRKVLADDGEEGRGKGGEVSEGRNEKQGGKEEQGGGSIIGEKLSGNKTGESKSKSESESNANSAADEHGRSPAIDLDARIFSMDRESSESGDRRKNSNNRSRHNGFYGEKEGMEARNVPIATSSNSHQYNHPSGKSNDPSPVSSYIGTPVCMMPRNSSFAALAAAAAAAATTTATATATASNNNANPVDFGSSCFACGTSAPPSSSSCPLKVSSCASSSSSSYPADHCGADCSCHDLLLLAFPAPLTSPSPPLEMARAHCRQKQDLDFFFLDNIAQISSNSSLNFIPPPPPLSPPSSFPSLAAPSCSSPASLPPLFTSRTKASSSYLSLKFMGKGEFSFESDAFPTVPTAELLQELHELGLETNEGGGGGGEKGSSSSQLMLSTIPKENVDGEEISGAARDYRQSRNLSRLAKMNEMEKAGKEKEKEEEEEEVVKKASSKVVIERKIENKTRRSFEDQEDNGDDDDDDDDDDDERMCGICLSEQSMVQVVGCGHGMCLDCALKLCRSGNTLRSVMCPFCRSDVKGFDIFSGVFSSHSSSSSHVDVSKLSNDSSLSPLPTISPPPSILPCSSHLASGFSHAAPLEESNNAFFPHATLAGVALEVV